MSETAWADRFMEYIKVKIAKAETTMMTETMNIFLNYSILDCPMFSYM